MSDPRHLKCPRGCTQSLIDYNSIWLLCESCNWLVARDLIAVPLSLLENSIHDQVLERFAQVDAEVRAKAADTDVVNPEYERGMLDAADMFDVVKQCATHLKHETAQGQVSKQTTPDPPLTEWAPAWLRSLRAMVLPGKRDVGVFRKIATEIEALAREVEVLCERARMQLQTMETVLSSDVIGDERQVMYAQIVAWHDEWASVQTAAWHDKHT